jgi:hypothetical protein
MRPSFFFSTAKLYIRKNLPINGDGGSDGGRVEHAAEGLAHVKAVSVCKSAERVCCVSV